jgi:hypothetical protein
MNPLDGLEKEDLPFISILTPIGNLKRHLEKDVDYVD